VLLPADNNVVASRQMLEASTEIPQAVPVFPLISPGDKEFTQSVSMTLTTRPENVTDLFVDNLTPLVSEKDRWAKEARRWLRMS
jgi:hypothetical protein